MVTEFNLSEQIIREKHQGAYLLERHVKEFIKRLKEAHFILFLKAFEDTNIEQVEIPMEDILEWIQEIDKLAGDDLK